jgi:hypothetical protein
MSHTPPKNRSSNDLKGIFPYLTQVKEEVVVATVIMVVAGEVGVEAEVGVIKDAIGN